jgi:HEAT repeat protein
MLLLALPAAPAAGGLDAGTPLSNAAPVLEDLGRRVTDRSVPKGDRLEIIRTLGEWATDQVTGPLVTLLGDPEPDVRAAASTALGWSGNSPAVKPLQGRATASGESVAVRAAAVRSLGQIGDAAGRPTVLAATADADVAIRGAALWGVTLGPLAIPEDRTSLLLRLVGDRALDQQLRAQGVAALAEASDPAVVEPLIHLLETEPPVPMPLPSAAPTQQEIMGIRYRQARDVRAWIVRTLGVLDARKAQPAVLKAADDPDDFFLRFVAVSTLVTWNPPEAVPVFLRRLGDPFPETRVAALAGIDRAGERGAFDTVLEKLADPSPIVRAQAVLTLANLDRARARPHLERLRAKDADSGVQRVLESTLR